MRDKKRDMEWGEGGGYSGDVTEGRMSRQRFL